MTHAAKSHEALERRDQIDALSDMADRLRDLAKDAKAREAQLAEARLLLGMALDVIKRGDYHPHMQQQVAGVRSQIRKALP
jgi:hypothetical protein